MPYTEFYVTKGAGASNLCGGGPRLGENDGAVYFLPAGAGGATVAEGSETQITDLSGANWAGALIDDWLCWDCTGAHEVRRITVIDGAVATVHAACTVGAQKPVVVGGAWTTVDYAASTVTTASVNAAGEAPRVNIGLGTYAETVVVDNSGTGALPITFEGFEATAGDGCPSGTRPIINGANVGASTWGSAKHYVNLKNIDLNKTNNYHCCFINGGLYNQVINVRATNSGTGVCFYMSGRGRFVNCQAIGNTAADGFWLVSYDIGVLDCTATGCKYGFNNNAAYAFFINCIAFGNDDDGFNFSGLGGLLLGCISRGNGGSGLRLNPATWSPAILNSIFTENTVAGIECDIPYYGAVADYNAFYGNGAPRDDIDAGVHDVALTADPFVNAAGGNFALNIAAAGGALCHSVGFPGTLIDALNIGCSDIGALQHRSARRSRGRYHGV